MKSKIDPARYEIDFLDLETLDPSYSGNVVGYIPGFIRVIIEKNGDMVVAHGQHRWAAAYLCGIKEAQCHLCKRI